MEEKTLNLNQEERHFIGNSQNGKFIDKYIYSYLGFSVPQYINDIDKQFGKVKAYPISYWRRLFKPIPYFVGDTVEFKLEVESLFQGSITELVIYERFKDEEIIYGVIHNRKTTIRGRRIPYEGDVIYSIGLQNYPSKLAVITAKVINRDTIFFQWFWFILGAIITFAGVILAWILGYLKIVW